MQKKKTKQPKTRTFASKIDLIVKKNGVRINPMDH